MSRSPKVLVRSRLLVLLLVVLFTASLHAAQPGEEYPIINFNRETAPLPGVQRLVGIADGGGTAAVVVWTDERDATQRLYFSAITPDGLHADTQRGVLIAERVTSAAVATTAAGAVVVYATDGGARMQRFGGVAAVENVAADIPAGRILGAVANGNMTAVLVGEPRGVSAHMIDLAGKRVTSHQLPASADPAAADVIVSSGEFRLVYASSACIGGRRRASQSPGTQLQSGLCETSIVDAPFGQAGQTRVVASKLPGRIHLDAHASGGTQFVIWSTSTMGAVPGLVQVAARRFESYEAPRTLATLAIPHSNVSVVFDGSTTLATWENAPAPAGVVSLDASRLDANGTPLDATPIAIGAGGEGALHALRTGQRVAIGWTERAMSGGADPRALLIPDFTGLSRSNRAIYVASAGAVQKDAVVAKLGDGWLSAWVEREAPSRIYSSFQSDPAVPGDASRSGASGDYGTRSAAVAGGSQVGLVAWIEEGPGTYTVKARRTAMNGMLFYEPIVSISTEPRAATPQPGDRVTAAANGEQFLVAWTTADGEIRAIRLDESAPRTIEAAPLVIAAANPAVRRGWPQAVWSGSEWLVFWVEQHRDSQQERIAFRPLSRDGVLDAGTMTFHDTASSTSALSAAVRGEDVAVTWISGGCVRASLLRADASRTTAVDLQCADAKSVIVTSTAVTPTATGFAAAWSERSGTSSVVKFVPLGSDLAALEQPFRVSPEGVWSENAMLVEHHGDALVLYVRAANEPLYSGVTRVFVRKVAR